LHPGPFLGGHSSEFTVVTLFVVHSCARVMQAAAIECDDFHIAVLMNCVEYKKQKNQSISIKMPFNVYSLFLKKLRLLSRLPGMQYIPVIVIDS
jgi:hypothetical protein